VKHTLAAVTIKQHLAAKYGVAFNPHATFSRTRLRQTQIDEAMTLANSLARAGYPVSAVVEEAFRGAA